MSPPGPSREVVEREVVPGARRGSRRIFGGQAQASACARSSACARALGGYAERVSAEARPGESSFDGTSVASRSGMLAEVHHPIEVPSPSARPAPLSEREKRRRAAVAATLSIVVVVTFVAALVVAF